MGDPRAVEAVLGFSDLVLPHPRQGDLVDLGVAPAGDERGHPAERVRAAAVAGLHEQLGVRAHERHRHRHLGAVRQDERGLGPELLDEAEHVVPAARVEPARVVPELPQDLVHLERGRDRLDEHGGADRALREPEPALGEDERVVPEPRLAVALELGEVEVGPAPSLEQPPAVVEDVEPEVEEAPRRGLAVHLEVALRKMPPAGPDEEGRDLLVQAVDAAVRVPVLDRARDGVDEVHLPLDHVAPGRRVRVLEVRHEDVRARVERVDDHLPLGRARQLDPPLLEILRGGRDRPRLIADAAGLGEEVEAAPGVEGRLALGPAPEQRRARRPQLSLEAGHEVERGGGQDLGEPSLDRALELDAPGTRHASRPPRG